MLTGDFSKAWISIHALLAESDRLCAASIRHRPISIHALLAESDDFIRCIAPGRAVFLSTLSLRRATVQEFQPASNGAISIHALLAESDSAAAIIVIAI